MVEVTCEGYQVKQHPTLGIWVRDDGAVLARGKGCKSQLYWTFGNSRNDGLPYKKIKWNYKPYYVHRLVAETFIDNPFQKPTVDHIDRNVSNNAVWNLRWATYKEQNTNTSQYLRTEETYGVHCNELKEYCHRYYMKHRQEILNKLKRKGV